MDKTKVLHDLAQKYLKSNSKSLINLFNKIEPTLKKIDALQKKLLTASEDDLALIREIGKDLSAYYHFINKTVKQLHALRHNKRIAFQVVRVSEYDNGEVLDVGEKPIKGTEWRLKSEAELFVADERDIYYKISGYVESCKSSISYCQSLIKDSETQKNQSTI